MGILGISDFKKILPQNAEMLIPGGSDPFVVAYLLISPTFTINKYHSSPVLWFNGQYAQL